MKLRSTVHWPEKGIAANELLDEDTAREKRIHHHEIGERIKAGFLVEHVEPDAGPAGGAHVEPPVPVPFVAAAELELEAAAQAEAAPAAEATAEPAEG